MQAFRCREAGQREPASCPSVGASSPPPLDGTADRRLASRVKALTRAHTRNLGTIRPARSFSSESPGPDQPWVEWLPAVRGAKLGPTSEVVVSLAGAC